MSQQECKSAWWTVHGMSTTDSTLTQVLAFTAREIALTDH